MKRVELSTTFVALSSGYRFCSHDGESPRAHDRGRGMHTKVLAARFDRDKAERVRNKFIEIQVLIDALDRAHSRQTPYRVVSGG